MHLTSDQKHQWAVILAGGEGVRLRSLTRLVSGEDTPKQFCPLFGGRTLLGHTKQRIARNISSERTVYVLLNSHERFYNKELRSIKPSRMIAQPCNRGTLPAILSSLVSIVREDKDAVVGFFPSDHHYSEEDKFTSGVQLAFDAAHRNPGHVILLGATAKHAETEYGWIEAEPSLSGASANGILRVKRFWEKPTPVMAEDLLEKGCVWNTFVMIGRAQAFLDLIRSNTPDVYREFVPFFHAEAAWGAAELRTLYEGLATHDFSRAVLSANPERLGIWSLGDVGWSDLGDPRRVMSLLSETGATHEWMTVWHERMAAVAAGS